jgi:hypothetical protein
MSPGSDSPNANVTAVVKKFSSVEGQMQVVQMDRISK